MNTGYTFPAQGPDKINIQLSSNGGVGDDIVPQPNLVDDKILETGIVEEKQEEVIPIVQDKAQLVIDIPSTIEIPTDILRSSTPILEQHESREEQKMPLETNVLAHTFSSTAKEASDPFLGEDYVLNLRQQMATDWKSPSEYALHILFTKFVRHAENKLNICLQYLLTTEPPIVDILGEGVDPQFDKIIESLGYIAKKKPKPVIDAMMFWRKTKSEVAMMAATRAEKTLQEYELEISRSGQVSRQHQSISPLTSSGQQSHSKTFSNGSRFSHRRNNSSKSSSGSKSLLENASFKELQMKLEGAKDAALQADRKSLISIYILCRVLIEIVKQAPDDGDDDLNDKLEEIVFTQLKTTVPLSISTSIIKSSNWNSFAELLGCMSEKKFISVSDRFIADLEKIPVHILPELEPSVHLLILGMRYLKLKNYPLEKFEESADFMKSIAKFFSKAENISVKLAYAEVTNQLLLPLTGSLTAEVNHPTWVESMSLLLDTIGKLQSNNKYWATTFKLTVSVLCASPPELFTTNWIPLLEKNVSKVRTRNLAGRTLFAVGLSRLVWVYLYRCPETLNNTTRTLKKLLTMYINSPKKKDSWLTTDLELINPLCDVLVTIGFAHPNFVIENAMLPLLKDAFNGSSLNNINYEKLILAINTYKGLLMTTSRPDFPENDNRFYDLNLNDIQIPHNDDLIQMHEEICEQFYQLFLLLDSNIGSEVWCPENEHQKQQTTQFGPFSFSFSSESSTHNNRNLNIAVFATLVETIPCCLSISSKIPFKSATEILSRNAVHADLLIATSCQNALKALASKRNPYTLITWFAKYSFDFDEKTQSSYKMSYLSSTEYKRLLVLYVELLECWIEEFRSSNVEEEKRYTGLDGIQLQMDEEQPSESNETQLLEWKNTVTVIEEVEGNGLFFLCSQDSSIRRLAIQILKVISKFDEVMVKKTAKLTAGHSRSSSHFAAERGTRLIDMLNDTEITPLLESTKLPLSMVEKNRLMKLEARYKTSLLIKLAESDYGVDTALWQRSFPKFLSILFEACPVTMALCRSIVCVRLVQVHGTILKVANEPGYKLQNVLPETIVNQWKLYLIVACTSLTSTNDQKLHIPDTSLQKKKSQQIFTVQHQKIKSAVSIFKMVLPLLNSKSSLVADAVIAGLSTMNVNIYKAYVEYIAGFLDNWEEKIGANIIRIEMFHILTILSPCIRNEVIMQDMWILKQLSLFLKTAKQFLQQDSIQCSYDYQPLRGYFAELLSRYYSCVKNHPSVEMLFPFQARTSCFNYLREWCGFGDQARVGEERYQSMIHKTKSNRDRTAIMSGIEVQRNKVETLSLECMVVLCSEPISQTVTIDGTSLCVSFDIESLLVWIDALLNSKKNHAIKLGTLALQNILEKNSNNVDLYKDIANRCFSAHVGPSSKCVHYTSLCAALINVPSLLLDEETLVPLGLYGLVINRAKTRISAMQLLSAVESRLHDSEYTQVFRERVASKSTTVYQTAANEISNIFAELLPGDLCLMIFSDIVGKLEYFNHEIQERLLILLEPWVSKIVLKSREDSSTAMILRNMFYMTIILGDKSQKQVENLWLSLGKGNAFQNIFISLEYIINSCINYRNPAFVEHVQEMILYLSNVSGSIGLIDSLLDNLEPRFMTPAVIKAEDDTGTKYPYPFVADVDKYLVHDQGSVIFSRAQLSIILVVNLLPKRSDFILPKLPVLLHVSVCLLDHYVPLIQESATKVIAELIYGLVPVVQKTGKVVDTIKDKQNLWSYDNLIKDKLGARLPKAMDTLIKDILDLFSSVDFLQRDWQKIALRWATMCSVRHVACRSFQTFRSLLTFLDQGMLKDMLHRLSNTISDSNKDIQSFAMQILMTLNAITAELDSADLINSPQLFWSLTACLNSIHEQEFIEVLSCLTKFIAKIDLDSPDTVQCLVATFPSNWKGRFDGLQQIVMIGLRSSNSLKRTWSFLDKLNLLNDSRIIAKSESRLLFALIANLPRFLNAMDCKDFSSIQAASEAMISLAEAYQQPSLSRLIESLAKNKFRSKKDFMSQVVSFITRNFFPDFSAQTLVFLLGLLFNKVGWVKIQTMEILKYILPFVDLSRAEFIGVGADLISPLLRLLLTEYEPKALEVLDCIGSVSGSKLDKDVLRISMGNKEVKNNGNLSTTLFGIPTESGWSVPMPSMTAATARHNVHAVYTTCTMDTADGELATEPPTIEDVVEFQADADYKLGRVDTNDTMSAVEDNDASLSHMWAELDNLDSFFTKNTAVAAMGGDLLMGRNYNTGRTRSDSTNTEQTLALESAPQLYDKKVSVILNRSLMRTPSAVSFKTNLADSFATNLSNEGLVSDIGNPKNPINGTSLYSTESPSTNTRSSHLLKSPSSSLLGSSSSSKSRVADSPQDTLFRFEGLLKSSQKGRKKWQYHQQHQQLLSQTIHEQSTPQGYEAEVSPLRGNSSSPVIGRSSQSPFPLTTDTPGKQSKSSIRQSRYQKHYHLPHFSTNRSQAKNTGHHHGDGDT